MWNRFSWKFRKIHRETPVNLVLNKVAGLMPAAFVTYKMDWSHKKTVTVSEYYLGCIWWTFNLTLIQLLVILQDTIDNRKITFQIISEWQLYVFVSKILVSMHAILLCMIWITKFIQVLLLCFFVNHLMINFARHLPFLSWKVNKPLLWISEDSGLYKRNCFTCLIVYLSLQLFYVKYFSHNLILENTDHPNKCLCIERWDRYA